MLSNNSSDDEDNDNPLPNIGNEAKNDFKDYAHDEEENDFNAMFFGQMYVYIFLIYPI